MFVDDPFQPFTGVSLAWQAVPGALCRAGELCLCTAGRAVGTGATGRLPRAVASPLSLPLRPARTRKRTREARPHAGCRLPRCGPECAVPECAAGHCRSAPGAAAGCRKWAGAGCWATARRRAPAQGLALFRRAAAQATGKTGAGMGGGGYGPRHVQFTHGSRRGPVEDYGRRRQGSGLVGQQV